MQLQHTATHQRMGGQGVGARPGRLDDEHTHAAAGQQHRGGRTGTPAADDDRVVVCGPSDRSSVRVEIVGKVSAQVCGVGGCAVDQASICGGAETASPSGTGRGWR